MRENKKKIKDKKIRENKNQKSDSSHSLMD